MINQKDYKHPFSSKNIALTGSLSTMTRSEAVKKIRVFEGNFHAQVNDTTDFLIVANKTRGVSSKEAKAKMLEASGHPIQILNEDDFLWLLSFH